VPPASRNARGSHGGICCGPARSPPPSAIPEA
jgi:hypothetical protein